MSGLSPVVIVSSHLGGIVQRLFGRLIALAVALVIGSTVLAAQPSSASGEAGSGGATVEKLQVDPSKTPGHTKKVKQSKLCKADYESKFKTPKKKTGKEVFKKYGIAKSSWDSYEIDHLVPVGIGGDNNKKNLWPQRKLDASEIDAKNKAEAAARSEVCDRQGDLKTAQRVFKEDWRAAAARFTSTDEDTSRKVEAAPVPTTTTTSTSTTTTTTTSPPPSTALAPATTAAPKAKSPSSTADSGSSDHYTNVDGNRVQSPSSDPNGASAKCKDGTYSYSQHRSGTCSHHGGVAAWL